MTLRATVLLNSAPGTLCPKAKPKFARRCVTTGIILCNNIAEGYGQTESTLLCGTFKKMNKWVKPGSIGKAAPGYDIRIVNNMGKEVPRGEQGCGHLCLTHSKTNFESIIFCAGIA